MFLLPAFLNEKAVGGQGKGVRIGKERIMIFSSYLHFFLHTCKVSVYILGMIFKASELYLILQGRDESISITCTA